MLVLLGFKNIIFYLKNIRSHCEKCEQVSSLISLEVLVFYEFMGHGYFFPFYQKQIHSAFQKAGINTAMF